MILGKLVLVSMLWSTIEAYNVIKMSTALTVEDTNLYPHNALKVEGLKKLKLGEVEQLILKNCSGVIDEETFKYFPKLLDITIWKSSIQRLDAILPINRLVILGSQFPDLINTYFYQKLRKLHTLYIMGNKNMMISPTIINSLNKLRSLALSQVTFTEDCITKEWFRNLDHLEELVLSDDNIRCLTEDAFNSLVRLRKLDLTYNRISDLEKKLFKSVVKLEKLGLYQNDIAVFDLGWLANQKNHLEHLGVSWDALKTAGITPEQLTKALPKLKSLSFSNWEMPNDFEAGAFCQILKSKNVLCYVDSEFGTSRIVGYSRDEN